MNLANKEKRRTLAIGVRHSESLDTGVFLIYRRTSKRGSWIAKVKRKGDATHYVFQPLGIADDGSWHSNGAQPTKPLDYGQAVIECWKFAKRYRAEEQGIEVAVGAYSVADCMADYVTHSARERKIKIDDAKLVRMRATIDAFILPDLGKLDCGKLTHSRLKSWRDAVADSAPRVRSKAGAVQAHRKLDTDDSDAVRRRQASTNRVLSTLKAGLNWAKSEKRITSDGAWVDVKPFRKVDLPRVRFLSQDEVRALVGACGDDFKALVTGALLSGCRYGELRALLVNEFKDGRLFIARSKNGSSRDVDLNGAGVAFFEALVKGRKPTELMFLKANGVAWQESEQKRYMDAACKDAGLEGVTFHILRHTWASHAVMNGMTIEVVGQQLGHKPGSPITARHYAHLSPQFKAESVKRNAPSFGFAS